MAMVVSTPQQMQTVWLSAVKAVLRRYSNYRARRRALAELRRVDPRALKDIGIDRSELQSIVYSDPCGRRRSYAAEARH